MKKIKNTLIILGLVISSPAFAQTGYLDKLWNQLTDTTFAHLVKTNNLIFTMPEGFVDTEVKKNDNVFYQKAIKDQNSNFEIRIYIKSIQQNPKEKKDMDLNKFSYSFMTTMALNASGNVLPNIPQIDIFPEEAVKTEFKADWGAATAFVPNSGFGKGFNFCGFHCLRLNDVCEVYVFFMFDDAPKQSNLMQNSFMVMKFK